MQKFLIRSVDFVLFILFLLYSYLNYTFYHCKTHRHYYGSSDSLKNLGLNLFVITTPSKLIQKNPGISSSEISKKINLARNTVKYHIDKLSENNLIFSKERGRKIELYSK